MRFTVEMIEARLPDLAAAARRETLQLGPARIAPAPIAGGRLLGHDDTAWPAITVGDRWGGSGQTCWLRLPLQVPSTWVGARVALHVALGDYPGDLSGPEALAYLDGVAAQGLDPYHRELLLNHSVADGAEHLLALEAYSSRLPGPQTLRTLELVRLDPEAEALYHDMRVLHGALLTMPKDALERVRLLRALERAYIALDLRQPLSDDYLRSVAVARAILRREAWQGAGGAAAPRTVAVGHAHIDLAWLWPVAQTRRKGARTFSSVDRLMEQYPHYHFVASQPALYKMVKEDEPELYQRVKARIAEGRWEPTGASWVEMDCNVTGAESLVRQFLYGKRFFRQELGCDPRVLWLPDVFGYCAALPQVLRGCGVDYFMTTKISWNEYNRLPYDTFRWRGIDGTAVLTHMVTAPLNPSEQAGSTMQPYYTYNAKGTPYDLAGTWKAYRQKEINDELLYLFGYGDGGGGPTAAMQETIERLAALPGFTRVEQSSAEAFFQRLEERVWSDPHLPEWVGELYLEYHRGTYTSQAWIKRANRLAELLYREAELWAAAVGALRPAAVDPAWPERLHAGWETILFNQFHDILPGSSINQVYADARVEYQGVFAHGHDVRGAALHALTEAVPTCGPALIMVNPAPFARRDPVEVALSPRTVLPGLTIQEITAQGGGRHVLVAPPADLPPLGYVTLPLDSPVDTGIDGASGLQITRDTLENAFFSIRLDETAAIVSLLDKRTGREVIAPGERANRLIAFEDRPLNFDAWDINIYYTDKPTPLDDVTEWRVVEQGPLRGGVEVVRRFGASTITQRMLIYRDVPRIDFPTHIEWRERQVLLKAAFPVTVNSPRATFEIQWGNVERPTHWNTSWDWARFETCAHKWVDLSEGDYGVSLLNDCKYGHDVKGHTLRLTLLKSSVSPDPEADQGMHEFSYALLPHPGDWRAGETVAQAYLFNMPARAAYAPQARQGTLPPNLSLVRTDRPGLVIETVKPAEDGDGLIVRVYDAHNSRGAATLTFPRPIVAAQETNMLEEQSSPVEISGTTLRFTVRPYGITTFRVRLAGP